MIDKELTPDEYFYFSGGKFLRNLEDLMNSMQDIDINLFNIHVNEQKNDFAAWVVHVFGEPNLAGKMKELSTPIEVYIFLKSFLMTNDLELAEEEVKRLVKKEMKGLTSVELGEFVREEMQELQEDIDEEGDVEEPEETEAAPKVKEPAKIEEETQPKPEPQPQPEDRHEEEQVPGPEEQEQPKPEHDMKEDKKFMATIESFDNRLDELKKRVGVCRKQGRDSLIPDLMLKNVKPKVALAKVTKAQDDIKTVEDIFARTEAELKEVEGSTPLNVKEEIDVMVHESLKADKISRQVKDIMVEDVITLPRNVSANMAAKLMADKGIGCVVIMEGDRPIGIVTERDIVKRVSERQINLEAVTAGSIMSSPIVTIDLNEDVLHASEMMKSRNFRRLVVTEGTKMVGLLTQTDLLKKISSKEREIKEEV